MLWRKAKVMGSSVGLAMHAMQNLPTALALA